MLAGARIGLSPAERERLETVRQSATSRRVWARATALLLLGSGTEGSAVCAALSISRNTLTNWKRRWNRGKCFQLADQRRSGRPPKATARYVKLLKEAVVQGPSGYGYVFTVWSTARLAEHLRRRTGIRLSVKRVRQLLKKLGFVYRRPKHTLKERQNLREMRAARQRLDSLKKGLWREAPGTSSGSKTRPSSTCIRT